MIALEMIQRMWMSLTPPVSIHEQVEARQIDSVVTPLGSPLITIDRLGQRHLLIPFSSTSKTIEDKQSAGIHVTTNTWGDGREARRFIDVTCLKPHLNELFDLVVFDIFEELEQDADRPDKVCRRVLNHWRELLEREAQELPVMRIIIGIFGELWTLAQLIELHPQALASWVGPHGARHDFVGTDVALEIKTTTQRKGRTVVIHGHDQLETEPGVRLFLGLVQVEERADGLSVGDLVKDILNKGADARGLLARLAQMNLRPDTIAKLEHIRFHVREQRLYEVDKTFPRITRESFKNEKIPNGVLALEYVVDLSGEPPYPLSLEQTKGIYQLVAECR